MVNKQVSNLFQAQNPAIASYDWNDLIQGRGIITFYGYSSSLTSDTQEYNLSSEVIISKSVAKQYSDSTTEGAGVEFSDAVHFDSGEIQTPLKISGVAKIVHGWAFERDTVANGQIRGTLKYILKKVSGETETTIASTSVNDGWDIRNSRDWKAYVNIKKMDCTDTYLKKGDILRLTIEMYKNHLYGTTSPSYGIHYCITQDPLNRDTTGGGGISPSTNDEETTQLKINIPFRIEI